MGKNLSIFDRNYALFMERFPKLAFLLSFSDLPQRSKEILPPIPLDEVEILYCYGIGRGEVYSLVKNWLHEKPERRLVFLSEDYSLFLQIPEAEEILLDPQIVLESPSEIDLLTERFPSNRVEIICLPSLKTRKFHSIRLQILRKTTLSHALYQDRIYGYQPFVNFIKNTKQLHRSFYANALKGCFSGTPAIICGAGPSLQKAIPHLKQIEDKALVIAGGSTIAALSSQGIMPHFALGVDPNLEEFFRLKNSFAFEVPFLYSMRIFPGVFQTCNGPFIYMRSGIGGMLELWMEEELGLADPLIGKNLSRESLSVTTICLAWAQWLGCNPIVLSGIDLAYTDKKHYASGVDLSEQTKSFASEINVADRIMKRKDRKGRSIVTAVRWVMEASSISHFAKMHPEIEFINATERGLGIKNIHYQPLQNIFSSRDRLNLKSKVQEAVFQSKMPPQSEKIIQTKIKELFSSLDRLIAHLEVLVKKPSPLDELELVEEIAYCYLFYDIKRLLEKEIDFRFPPWLPLDPSARSQKKWQLFLELAKKYKLSCS